MFAPCTVSEHKVLVMKCTAEVWRRRIKLVSDLVSSGSVQRFQVLVFSCVNLHLFITVLFLSVVCWCDWC